MPDALPAIVAKRSLATVLALVLPGRDPRTDIAKLALSGAAMTGFFLFTSPYFFPGGADHFTQWADALAHGTKLIAHLAQRDVGFPLLILLSGYTATGSLIGVTLVHALFAILMPVLLYLAIYRMSQPVAFYTGICAILSLAPVYFMKWIHHDQTYIFFIILTIALLASYLQTRHLAYLYLFTAAILAASISRPAGNILFPIFLVIAYLGGRGRLIHYLVCACIFVTVTAGYLWHRYAIFDMAHQPSLPSYTGQQVFYNVYMNSAEFGVRLSPDIGPNMAAIVASLERATEPSLRESTVLKYATYGVPQDFMEAHIYRYSPQDFVRRVLEYPNWEYYQVLSSAEPNDQIVLKAALEVLRAYPWYPIAYTARNLAHLLAAPGFAHTRYNVNPFGAIGLDFPAATGGTGVEGTANVTPRAGREVRFDPLSVASTGMRNAFAWIGETWGANYQFMVRVTLALMAVAWIGVIVRFTLLFRHATPRLSALTGTLTAKGLSVSIVAASVLLLYNFGVTAAFVEPDYRYHHFMMLLRILIAGYGVVLLLRLIPAPESGLASGGRKWPVFDRVSHGVAAIRAQDGFAWLVQHYPRLTAVVVCSAIVAVLAWWTRFMVLHTW